MPETDFKKNPYVLSMEDLCDIFTVTRRQIYRQIAAETFPVPTYKIGKYWVADVEVVRTYFKQKRREGATLLREMNR